MCRPDCTLSLRDYTFQNFLGRHVHGIDRFHLACPPPPSAANHHFVTYACMAVARGYGGLTPPPPTFVELTYSENRVGHSENYGNNSITKF
jgi:hypothetical protein